jgi:hypothetical protein
VNISRGGLFVHVPHDAAPPQAETVEVDLAAPGTDARVAEFFCQARVVRHQHVGDGDRVGVGLEFSHPLPLALGT